MKKGLTLYGVGSLVPQQISTHGAKNDALRAMRVLGIWVNDTSSVEGRFPPLLTERRRSAYRSRGLRNRCPHPTGWHESIFHREGQEIDDIHSGCYLENSHVFRPVLTA